MKLLLGYWVIGCAFIGLAFGASITQCPKDEVAMAELVGAVAIWPAFFAAAVARTGEPPLNRACKVAP